MDDRELTARIKALSKAVTSEPPATVIKLLEELKRDAKPTEEQLRVSLALSPHQRRAIYVSGTSSNNFACPSRQKQV